MTDRYVPKLKRWKHQDEALSLLMEKRAFALFLEMRTGKTKCILDEFGQRELDGSVKDLLVIAPAGVYRTWSDAVDDHVADSLRSRMKLLTWSAKESTSKAASRELDSFMRFTGPRVLLMNVEALSTVKRARELAVRFLSSRRGMCVIDESTSIKGPDSLRTQFVALQLAPLASLRRILSGLPSPQSPLDLYSQFYFLDPSILYSSHGSFKSGFVKFRYRYAVMERLPFGPNRRMIDVVRGYKNLDQLAELVKPSSIRVRLEDCYELPPKLYQRLDVELTDEQRRIYKELKTFAIAHLSAQERVTATMVITQLLRLQQVLTGHVRSDDGTISEVASNRVGALTEFLELTDRKVVIWARFDHDVRKIAHALAVKFDPSCTVIDQWGREVKVEPTFPNRTVARFWGGNVESREGEERAFKTDPECRFMVATPMSGGRGRTWDVADVMVYFSNSESLEHRLQSEERPSAVGKKGSLLVVDMVAGGTVDEKILKSLRAKIDLSSAITGDDWREWVV